MEIDNVRGIRPEDGRSDESGGSGEPAVPASDETVSIADFDNVIAIGEFETVDIEVIDNSREPGYIKEEIRKELKKLQDIKPLLNHFERESYEILANDPWFKQIAAAPRILLAVLQYPPFYLYKMKSTGHHAFIKSYEEAKKGYKDRYAKGEITVTLELKSIWNQDLLYERMIRFCPLKDLERLQHRKIAERERLVSHGAT
jgi:hypothetical protein